MADHLELVLFIFGLHGEVYEACQRDKVEKCPSLKFGILAELSSAINYAGWS